MPHRKAYTIVGMLNRCIDVEVNATILNTMAKLVDEFPTKLTYEK